MNPTYAECKFKGIPEQDLSKLFRHRHDPKDAVDLLKKILKYEPKLRISPFEALKHTFFDELREESTKLPGGVDLPILFDFSFEER